jgi:hypothetical protein
MPSRVHADLILQVEKRYPLKVQKITEFERHHKDPVVNLILETDAGERFFLKQIQPHSFRPGLEDIYSLLSLLHPHSYRLVLPIADSSGQFIFEVDRVPFVLMSFEEMSPFTAEKVEAREVLAILSDLHERVRDFPLQRQAHRTFEGWLRRGPEQIRKRFGNAVPFVEELEHFLNERLPAFRFQEGVIHWDIHRFNFGVDPKGDILLLDFDLLQPGPLAVDLMKVAPMFRDTSSDQILIPEETLMRVFSSLQKVVSASPGDSGLRFERRDFRFLVGRCVMMEVWDWPDVDQRQGEVRDFLQAIEDWVVGSTP